MKKRILSVVLALALLLNAGMATAWAATGNPAAKPGSSEPVYEVKVSYNVEIPMRDGVITRANIYVPEGAGPWPTILVTTPYSNANISHPPVDQFAACGYVVVHRDVRGIYTSDGVFTVPSALEIDDQYDTMDWIVAQDWSDGRIGALGASQLGQIALFTASTGHPNLVCVVPEVTSENIWRDGWYYRNGVMELAFLSFWSAETFGRALADRYLDGAELEAYLDNLAMYKIDPIPFTEVVPVTDFLPSALTGEFNLLKLWAEHPTFDEYMALNSPSTYISAINVPMMHIGGWYDIFSNGAFQSYFNTRHNAVSKFARDNQYLVMGPWGHMGDMNVALDREDFAMAFMDYWLKDLQRPYFNPDMHFTYYTMRDGSDEWTWRLAEEYPLSETQEAVFYLNGGNSGSIESLNDGTMSAKPSPHGTPAQTYVYDPMDPTPTRGGNLTSVSAYAYGPDGVAGAGPLEQTPVDRRSLTFTSEPLSADLEILGKVIAVVYASTDAVDTDFVVRLNDVAPDGSSTLVVDGIVRGRFRNSTINPTLLEPGEIYELEVDLWANSWIFQQGHRLRVTINSSSFPRWSRNMNVAEFPEQATEWAVANNTIYLDAEHPSQIILPVIQR